MNPVIDEDGTKEWYNQNGELHRADGPAVEWACGDKEWYLNGKKQAIEWANGTKLWYHNGKLHRINSPAVAYSNGGKEWYQNGELHRVDGPAIELSYSKAWYLNGIKLSEEEHKRITTYPLKELPLFLGMGYDKYISERLKNESGN